MGPVLIFDKSTLQALNVDQAVWLDQFFISNITPLFWVETLADLEKKIRKNVDRSPEDIVANLALKTPDSSSKINVHHGTLISAELLDGTEIDMRWGRVIIPYIKPLELEGKKGIVCNPSPEEEAFKRWRDKQFLDLERTIAKKWRQALSNTDLRSKCDGVRSILQNSKPKTLSEVKQLNDKFLGSDDQEDVIRFVLRFFGIPLQQQEQILSRWEKANKPLLRQFAPYFHYVVSVDLFFYLAIGSDLISSERPSHKVDLAYLYYWPFCNVFSSNDKLHAELAPFFLNDSQIFLKGSDLKADLSKLNEYYLNLPEDVKQSGVFAFASHPPFDGDFFVSKLWDKYLPQWRLIFLEYEEKSKLKMTKEANQSKKHDAVTENLTQQTEITDQENEMDPIIISRQALKVKGSRKRLS